MRRGKVVMCHIVNYLWQVEDVVGIHSDRIQKHIRCQLFQVAEPLFRAELTAEALAVGFALTPEEIRGFVPDEGPAIADDDAREADPGWFFIFEEHPKEPRFGLDVPGSGGHGNDWSKVSWAHAAPASAADPGAWDGAIDLSAANASALPADPPWNGSAADMAGALMQKPFRIGVHGARLLPPPDQETE